MRLLLDHGANANLADPVRDGITSSFVYKLFRTHFGDIYCSQMQRGITPLLAAASGGRAETVRLLLERGADINHTDYVRVVWYMASL